MKNVEKDSPISKVLTGITGLDEITFGGFPENRSTLITGYAGSGKTVFSMHFILNGINLYDEPGVFISMEESEEELKKNMAAFGFDIEKLIRKNKLYLENINIRQTAIYKAGSFDLSPVFLRIEEAVKKVGAKRIAIDTFEQIFIDIRDKNVFRQELVRLINWLKEKELTAVFTSESPKDPHKKSSIEEFITDCVINLKHQVLDSIYTRRLHILKYRGSGHGTNEYPFLINDKGISLLPVTSEEAHKISSDIIPTGIEGLDEKIEKRGFYYGSSTLISGTSGAGKTSFAVAFCYEALKQNKKCLFFSFEESSPQLKRNMKSLGYDLEEFEKNDLLKINSARPTLMGLEAHLLSFYRNVEEFNPDIIVFDPITDLVQIGTRMEVRAMLFRMIDYMKGRLITILFTALISSTDFDRSLGMSSLVDNWLKLRLNGPGGESSQYLSITKIRGVKHSHDEFILDFSKNGLRIIDD
ncbi:MAG: circadian clock protein KaiC [Bacteroidota bacterium]